jgi:hypothetical protein
MMNPCVSASLCMCDFRKRREGDRNGGIEESGSVAPAGISVAHGGHGAACASLLGGGGVYWDHSALVILVLRLSGYPPLERWQEGWMDGCGRGGNPSTQHPGRLVLTAGDGGGMALED